MNKLSQLAEFALFFHQDFGESPDDSLKNNVISFFSSPDYQSGAEFISQVNDFTKVAFSVNGRGSLWGDLGAGRWIKELENPQVWEALKNIAERFPGNKEVLSGRNEFIQLVEKLIS
jgi:hypothetical protein